MADPFFGSSGLPSLGSGKHDNELLTADIEDEFDALNDETFGSGINADLDWEDGHEKLRLLEEEDKGQNWTIEPSSKREQTAKSQKIDLLRKTKDEDVFANETFPELDHTESIFQNPDEELEHSISRLMLDDELDDPAIMNISQSKPSLLPTRSLFNHSSPPPPAILESNHVGSPSTNSIWAPPLPTDNFTPRPQKVFSALFPKLESNTPQYTKIEDPSIVGIGEDIRKNVLPVEIKHKAKMVYEIERDLLNISPKSAASPFENAERESPSHGLQTKSAHKIIRIVDPCNDMRRRSSPQNNGTQFKIGSPVNTLQGGNAAYSPIQIPGSKTPSQLPVDLGLCISPPTYGVPSSTSPVASTFTSPKLNLKSLMGQPYLSHLVPPQVGFPRPVWPAPIHAGRAFLGHPLRFPPGLSPLNRPPPPHPRLIPFSPPQMRFMPRVAYFESPYRRPPAPYVKPYENMSPQRPRMPNRFDNSYMYPPMSHGIEEDEYANLMTPKEKEWLIKIQMIQLQTTNPYLDDFYYTTYMMKKKIEEQNKGGGDRKSEPKLVVPETSKTEMKTYTPAQFEGSLGKLQAVSVNFPRKIIDLDVMHPEEGENEPSCNKELRRFRQLSMEIEKLYALFLKVDDFEKKMAALPKEVHQPLEDLKRANISSIFNSLSTAVTTEDKFTHIMAIRKGRNFVWRTFVLFSKEEKLFLLFAILNNWTPIMKKFPQDEALTKFFPYFNESISEAPLKTIIEMGKKLWSMPEVSHRSGTPVNPKLYILQQTKLGVAVTYSLICQANKLIELEVPESKKELQSEWSSLIDHVLDVYCSVSNSLIQYLPMDIVDLLGCHTSDKKKLLLLESKIQEIHQKNRKGSGDVSM